MNSANINKLFKDLDRAVLCGEKIFQNNWRSKIQMAIFNPKKVILRKIVVGFLKQRYPFLLKSKTFFGSTMFVHSYDKCLWFCGMYPSPSPEIRLSKYIIKNITDDQGEIFFDIGAHHGFYTLLVNKISNGNVQIHSFEPNKLHFFVLTKNVGRFKNISIHNKAVSSKKGTVKFFENKMTLSTLNKDVASDKRFEFNEVEVIATTLDDYCSLKNIKPTFLKIDVEGAENDVLLGAVNILATSHPVVAVEIWGGSKMTKNHTDAISILTEHGYIPYKINDSGDLIKITGSVSESVSDVDGFDNFIFKKERINNRSYGK